MTEIFEYGWQDSQPTHAHAYLFPVIDRRLAEVVSRSGVAPEKLRIFDAGCGNGALAVHLHRQGFQVAGCDASEQGVTHARKTLQQGRFEVISVYDDLPGRFGGACWDVVVAAEVIEHLYNPRALVANAHALLRPGGTFILTTPYHGYLKNVVLALTGKMDGHFTALWDGGHIKFWSYRTLRRLLEEKGFGCHDFAGAGRFPWLWKSMVIVSVKR